MRSMMATAGAILLAATVSSGTAADQGPAAPTVDCSRARGQVERLICRDPGLAALDLRLSEVYDEAMRRWSGAVAAGQRALQSAWIRGRNECWKADDVHACTAQSYQTRIVELQIGGGLVEASSPVGWLCAGYEETPFTTAFYRNTESPAAVITFGDDQVVAPIARSGSGSRYATADVEFWEHQGDASVSWFGTTFTCRPVVTSASQLSESSWALARFQPAEGPPLVPGPGRRFTLAFGSEGRLQVQADCNRGTGTWQSSGGAALTLGPVALTRATCQSPIGDRFVRDLDEVRSFTLSDGRLVLELAEGAGTYEFEPNVAGRP